MFEKFVTHSGTFHLDELFSYTIIKEISPEIKLIRTRDEEIINDALYDEDTILADLGKELDYDLYNLDHHFSDFNLEGLNDEGFEVIKNKTIFGRLILNIFKKTNLDIKLLTIVKDKNFSLKVIKNIIDTYINENNSKLHDIIISYEENIDGLKNIESIEDYVNFYLDNEIIKIIKILEEKITNNTGYDITNVLISKIENIIYYAKYELYKLTGYRKFSSAGLIFNLFGEQYIEEILDNNGLDYNQKIVNFIFNKIDGYLVSYIDKIDNGIIENSEKDNIVGIEYIVKSYNVDDIFSKEQNLAFYEASNVLSGIISNEVIKYYNQAKNRDLIDKIIEDNKNNTGEYLIIDKYLPGIERKMLEDLSNKFFIIYKSADPNTEGYYIKSLNNGNQRLLSNDILKNKDEIPGLKFIHTGRFIALFDTLDNLLNAFDKYQN